MVVYFRAFCRHALGFSFLIGSGSVHLLPEKALVTKLPSLLRTLGFSGEVASTAPFAWTSGILVSGIKGTVGTELSAAIAMALAGSGDLCPF